MQRGSTWKKKRNMKVNENEKIGRLPATFAIFAKSIIIACKQGVLNEWEEELACPRRGEKESIA